VKSPASDAGFYDGWAPNYMFYIANGHNAIGRFYETYGARVPTQGEIGCSRPDSEGVVPSEPPLPG